MLSLLEFLCVAAIATAICANPIFRQWFRDLSSKSQLSLIGLIALIVAGHFARSSNVTFPFVTWDMYTEVATPSTLNRVELEGVTEDGESISINPSRLFPSLGFGTLRIHNLLHSICTRAMSEKTALSESEHALLVAIAVSYERQNPGIELKSISMLWVELPFRQPAKEPRIVETIML